MSNITKILFLLLLATTFSLGILLVQTMGERDVAALDLKNAKAIIKENEGTIKDERQGKDAAQSDFEGCKSALKKLNQDQADNSLAQDKEQREASSAASDTLSTLSLHLDQDRITGHGPQLATLWLRELFK